MTTRARPFRLAIVASHAVQYQAPLFRRLARCPAIDLTVLFCSNFGAEPYFDRGFERPIQWDRPLLDGYRSQMLWNGSPRPDVSRFWGVVNPEVVRVLRNGRFDAVWLNGWSRASYWLAMAACIASGIPVLMRGETNLLAPVPPWKRLAKKGVLGTLFRWVQGFLAIGSANRDFYRAHGVDDNRIFLTPYAVDNDFFLSRARELARRRDELRRNLGLSEAPIVMFCGKLGHVKAPGDLLEGFARVRRNGERAILLFVGDGPLRGALENRVQELGVDGVVFAGFKNQEELPSLYAAADVLVVPSLSEAWGLVVNEAMCFGLPVIVSDRVGAAVDLVREGENGFIFPVGDIDRLAEDLSSVLRDSDLRRRLGQRSREKIRRWSYEEDVSGLLECLESIAVDGRLPSSAAERERQAR